MCKQIFRKHDFEMFNRSQKLCGRSGEADDDEGSDVSVGEPGLMKPDIVFFGEGLGDEFNRAVDVDRDEVDLVIVMGSSLRVAPVSDILSHFPQSVPQIILNKTQRITHYTFDIQLLGAADIIVDELARRLSWNITDANAAAAGLATPSTSSSVHKFVEPCYTLFPDALIEIALSS